MDFVGHRTEVSGICKRGNAWQHVGRLSLLCNIQLARLVTLLGQQVDLTTYTICWLSDLEGTSRWLGLIIRRVWAEDSTLFTDAYLGSLEELSGLCLLRANRHRLLVQILLILQAIATLDTFA